MSWQEEAKGIEPWGGAMCVDHEWKRRERAPLVGVNLREKFVVDLSDPDTRAAFDRRLALRLGAPAEATTAGVVFYKSRYKDEWQIVTGDRGWWRPLRNLGTDDPLLARVRAWKSVAG
jgi:hypothetical protein